MMCCKKLFTPKPPEQPIISEMNISVTDEPATITLTAPKTVVHAKGKTVPSKELILGPGTYVIGEVLKNLYIRDYKGQYVVYDKIRMIVAERTF